MKKTILFSIAIFICGLFKISAEVVYTNASQLTLIGKAHETKEPFHRVDNSKYNTMPDGVKKLFTNSAGLVICFKTTSPTINAKWTIGSATVGTNMTPIANKGLDLYIKKDGKWQHAGVGRPGNTNGNAELAKALGSVEKECLVYLPLYNEIKTLEIGVEKGSVIEALPNPFNKKIVIYGSSVLQGASASRPGLAYPSILGRRTGLYFINLGLSGSAKMEEPVIDMIADIEADAYILDCIPNPSPDEIKERAAKMIMNIRNKHPEKPIIVIGTIMRELGTFNKSIYDWCKLQNKTIEEEVLKLQESGVKDLYMIKEDNFLGTDHEGSTDGIHPNDIGFERMLEKIQPQLTEIFKQYNILEN